MLPTGMKVLGVLDHGKGLSQLLIIVSYYSYFTEEEIETHAS